MFTQLNERDVETYIDNELKNLKWNDNPQDMNECNVYKQRVKTTKQKNKLKKLNKIKKQKRGILTI